MNVDRSVCSVAAGPFWDLGAKNQPSAVDMDLDQRDRSAASPLDEQGARVVKALARVGLRLAECVADVATMDPFA